MPDSAHLQVIALADHGIRLEPLVREHIAPLQDAVEDGGIGAIPYVNVPGRDGMAAWVEHALAMREAGRELPFAIVAGERIVGSTRFYDIDLSVPTLAIGYTFHAASTWRTHVNTANKRLMLGHAFDSLGAQSVYFHTSHLNLRSRAAIERLGAQRDGILRAHKRHKDGSLRDTHVYSIVAPHWPAIRSRLDARLAAGCRQAARAWCTSSPQAAHKVALAGAQDNTEKTRRTAVIPAKAGIQ